MLYQSSTVMVSPDPTSEDTKLRTLIEIITFPGGRMQGEENRYASGIEGVT